MKIRFLLDEHLPQAIIGATLDHDEAINIILVGSKDAPLIGTLDPDLLLFCEGERRVLVTNNRKSMPGHIADHLAADHHHWGVFKLRKNVSIGELAAELHLYWEASEAEEWIDREIWIP